jgi:hypothetical protein
MGAIIFWSVIGIMAAMFLVVQLWLACKYCKGRRSRSPASATIQTAVTEQENYGGTANNCNPAIAGGVRLFPADIEQLLPAEPGDSHFPDPRNNSRAPPPPSYNEATGPEFYNPPVNPYFSQLT